MKNLRLFLLLVTVLVTAGCSHGLKDFLVDHGVEEVRIEYSKKVPPKHWASDRREVCISSQQRYSDRIVNILNSEQTDWVFKKCRKGDLAIRLENVNRKNELALNSQAAALSGLGPLGMLMAAGTGTTIEITTQSADLVVTFKDKKYQYPDISQKYKMEDVDSGEVDPSFDLTILALRQWIKDVRPERWYPSIVRRLNLRDKEFRGDFFWTVHHEDFDESLDHINQIINKRQDLAEAYRNRSIINEALGNLDQSIQDLETWQRLSSSPLASAELGRLHKIRDCQSIQRFCQSFYGAKLKNKFR